MNALKRCLEILALPLLLILIWWVASANTTNLFVPQPVPLVSTFIETWFGDRITTDVLPSLGRLAAGVLLSIALGVSIGLLIGSYRWLREFSEPMLEFFRATPSPVLVPILMLLLGVNDPMKVAVIVSGCIWPVLLNTVEGVRATDSVMRDTCRTYGISGWRLVRFLILPSASPQIMTGVRQCMAIGLILMVISEMFASSSGLGFTVVQFQRSFAIDEMWSGIVLLGLIGIALSFIFQWTERRVLRWYHGMRRVESGA